MLVTVKSENYFSYVLGSTYLEILRDDLTNIYINSSMQFPKNKQFIYFASIVVAFVSLVLRNYHYAATSFNSCA